jgi:putative DNA methylase
VTTPESKQIDSWFPCAAVDAAVTTPAGSGLSEKAVFTWFASRPIAQARAAVLTALLPDSAAARALVERAVRVGDAAALRDVRRMVADLYPSGRPVVVDVFSGRAMIPLEAARAGAVAVGIDLSPVATLGGRLLASYPARDWCEEAAVPFAWSAGEAGPVLTDEPRLVSDVRRVLSEVGRRAASAVAPYFPPNPDGSLPWAYLWAITILCDGCNRRFPLVGGLTLRNPYRRTNDSGQALRIITEGDRWRAEVIDGVPDQAPTFRTATGRRGKSAHCPFCRHVHSLDAVKAKGFAGEYQDALLAVADHEEDAKKTFRVPRAEEIAAAAAVDLSSLLPIGRFPAVPDEPIPAGNVHTVRGSGYGVRTYGALMCARQALQFVEAARAIRAVHADLVAAGISEAYAEALAAYAGGNLVRRLRRATRGTALNLYGKPDGSGQNRVNANHIFSDESKVSFGFDYLMCFGEFR